LEAMESRRICRGEDLAGVLGTVADAKAWTPKFGVSAESRDRILAVTPPPMAALHPARPICGKGCCRNGIEVTQAQGQLVTSKEVCSFTKCTRTPGGIFEIALKSPKVNNLVSSRPSSHVYVHA
jgi:hypothetical protein